MNKDYIKWLENNFDNIKYESIYDVLETIFDDFLFCININAKRNNLDVVICYLEMFKILNRKTLTICENNLVWENIIKHRQDQINIIDVELESNLFEKLYPHFSRKLNKYEFLTESEKLAVQVFFMTYYHNCKLN